MYVATDCVIFEFDEGSLKLLIFKRRIKPLIGEWSLIGSFVKLDEDVSDAAKRVLEEITGLEIFYGGTKMLRFSRQGSGYRCISITHYALIRIGEYDKERVRNHGAHWYDIDEMPNLVLDHNQMVSDALERKNERPNINYRVRIAA